MNGAERIAAERQRQIEVEGYTAEHDRQLAGQLALAAASYALQHMRRMRLNLPYDPEVEPPHEWPWHPRYWKPTPDDRVKELTKAGALIAAAIDDLLASAAAKPIEVLRTSTGTSEEES